MNIKQIASKLMAKNGFVKPLSVVTASTPALAFLLSQSTLFMEQQVDGTDYVMVTEELVKSLQGAMVLVVLLISIIYIYKPPKLISFMLIFGGLALFASALLQTIGVVFLTYGAGLIFNSLTVDKVIRRNNEINAKILERKVDSFLGGR